MDRWAIPYFRRYRLAEVEPPDVREFIGHLEANGLKPSTIRAVLAPVKAMYATAVEDGAVRFNPTRDVRIGGHRDREEKAKALTRQQLCRLLAEVPDEWRLLFEFLSHTGLRVSEAAGLTWADVEFGERPRIRLRAQDCRGEVGSLKSDSSKRTIPLSPGMADRLWTLGADRPADERVFRSADGARLDRKRAAAGPQARRDTCRIADPRGEMEESAQAGVLGGLSQLPAHVRVAAFRVGEERQAGSPPG